MDKKPSEIKTDKDLAGAFVEFKDSMEQSKKDSDVLVETKMNKLGDEISKKLEENQIANEKKNAELEAALNRPSSDAKAESLEFEAKANEAMKGFFKSNADSFEEFVSKSGLDEKSMREAVDSDGGYMVRSQFGGIINGRIFETSNLRDLATQIQATGNSIEFVLDDDEFVSSSTTEEGARAQTGTPSIGQVRIDVHENYAKAPVSQSMLDDVPAVDAWAANKIAKKISRAENTGFITGDGVTTSRGILTYDAWTTGGVYERNKIEQLDSGANGGYTYDGLALLQGSLKEDYQSNAQFLVKRLSFAQKIMTLKDDDSRPIFNIDFTKPTLANPMILGKPVKFADDMPTHATGSLSLAYGDFREGYTILDRLGLRLVRDPYSAKPFVEFYAYKRTGGGVTNFEAIKLQKLTT